LRRRIGWKYGDLRDDVAKTDPALKLYRELTDKDKEPNRTVARVMPAKLADVGYELVRQLPGSAILTEPLPVDVCAKLARHEHDRWPRTSTCVNIVTWLASTNWARMKSNSTL
jgi:hypothetical protein